MRTRKKSLYTGQVLLHNGWEIRPGASKQADGTFVPELATRRHKSGSKVEQVVVLDALCHSKEAAFQMALAAGISLVCLAT